MLENRADMEELTYIYFMFLVCYLAILDFHLLAAEALAIYWSMVY